MTIAPERPPATAPVAEPRPVPRAVQITTGAFLTMAGLMAWVLLYAGPLSSLQHLHSQSELYAHLRHELVLETAPLGGSIPVGDPVALITADGADLHGEVVVEGTSARELEAGPGHLRTSPLPGQAGVSVLFGRSVTFGGPFAHLTRLTAGDPISVTTQQGRFTYTVLDVRHIGDPVPSPPAAGTGRLVLVSSEGQGWRSGWAPSRQVFVDATLTGAVQPTPPGRPTAVSAAERAMAADTSRMPLVVLGLQLLLIAIAAVLWVDARGSRTRAWVIGVPVLLAALWFVSQTAAAVIPNLI